MNRLTDEELAELKRLEREATPGPWSVERGRCFRSITDACQGIIAYGSDDGCEDRFFDECDATLVVAARNALPSLLAEVRERRSTAKEKAVRKHVLDGLRLELKIARKQVRSRAQHVSMLKGVLELERKELRELRAYKAQVERVKACPGDNPDECVNGARATLGTRGIDGTCVKCGGLPDRKGEG